MAVYAFGDIHGMLDSLVTAVNHGNFQRDDILIFLGDYIDRGPDSSQTIDYLLKLNSEHECIFLKGNHEIALIASRFDTAQYNLWMKWGGRETLKSYGPLKKSDWAKKINQTHWDFLEKTLPYYELEKNIFVHAGLTQGVDLVDQNHHDLYWKKYEVPYKYIDDKVVICGHTSRKNGIIADFGHTICIDTYAYGGQWLTCLEVDTGKYMQTKSDGSVNFGQLKV